MENATKALLIAGSVLIAILLIVFGLKILNSTNGTTKETESSMKTTSASSFNNKFMPYVGKNISKNQAISLINMVAANNAVSEHKITVQSTVTNVGLSYNPSDSNSSLDNILNAITYSTKDSFKVIIPENQGINNGYITSLLITANN